MHIIAKDLYAARCKTFEYLRRRVTVIVLPDLDHCDSWVHDIQKGCRAAGLAPVMPYLQNICPQPVCLVIFLVIAQHRKLPFAVQIAGDQHPIAAVMQHEYTAGAVFLLLRIFLKRQRPKCLKPDILIFTEANRHACHQSDLPLPDPKILRKLALSQIVIGMPVCCQSQIDAADSIPKEIRF